MPTLHALLVGINSYPNQQHVLRGCINDVQRMHRYLETYCATMGYTFRTKTLIDSAATRKCVIEAFGHFEAAGKDDCCLFHFSGHGARWQAPEEFKHLAPDYYLESLVCHDSRSAGGYDLMDKEVSYLVWKASQKTELPFITIFDSCHSGEMRSIPEVEHDLMLEVVGVRGLRGNNNWLPLEKYTGLGQYHKSADGKLSPPLGRRIHLGAARNVEFAKEVNIAAQPRNIPMGIFSYSLIETLSSNGPLISYADLLHSVNVRIRQNVEGQSAQLGATFTADRNQGFLFSRLDARRPSYLVSWDKDARDWFVNAGALHGMPAGDPGSRTLLELTDDKRMLTVESVQPGRSKVSGMQGCDTKRSYVATIKRRAIPKLSLAFAPGNDSAAESTLKNLIEQQAPDVYQLVDAPAAANYRIHAGGGACFLTGMHDDRPLFKKVSGPNPEQVAKTFLECLDNVATWQQLLDLRNPETEIGNSEISLHLYRLPEARAFDAMNDDAPMEAIDWQNGPCEFWYFRDGDDPLLPAFQLRIRNNSDRPLWVGLLYLDGLFGIWNELLPKVALGPGEKTWARWVKKGGHSTRTIPLQIDDPELAVVDEYMKLLISTDELDTGHFNQPSLEPDVKRREMRGPVHFSKRRQPEQDDWAARTVWMRVRRGERKKSI